VLATVLTYVAAKHSVFFGGSLLFTYALGMGSLFFVLAAGVAALPRSGGWMEAVKSVFGVVMVVMAAYFLRNVIPPLGHYGDWRPRFASIHAGIALAGLLVGGIHLSFHDGWSVRLRKASGVAAIAFGCFGLIGWYYAPKPLDWQKGERATLDRAKALHKPVMLDFSAEWCIPCQTMDSKVFSADEVRHELERFVIGKIDLTEDTEANTQVKEKYGANTLPTVVLLSPEGRVLHHWDHEIDAPELLEQLRKIE
jgi:thiol:disulfide interchange protein DsbD